MKSWLALIALLLAIMAAARPAVGQQESAPSRVPHNRGCPTSADRMKASAIRALDASVRLLLIEGCRQSPTLRRLADDIGRTDGVVYLTTGVCPLPALRGCLLHTITDTGNARYLWIRLNSNTDQRELVATMAHELEHAREVLSHAHVRTRRDLLKWYRSAGSRAYGSTTLTSPFRAYETREAIDVGTAVRSELTDPIR